MNDKLNFEARYPQSVGDVWNALTSPEALSRWLMPNNFRAEPGHRFQFRDTSNNVVARCEVLEIVPGRSLRFSWDDGEDEPPSIVAWTVQPSDGGGTTLTVEHVFCSDVSMLAESEAGMNWRALVNVTLSQELHRNAGTWIPMVYAKDDFYSESTRVAGLTRLNGQYAALASSKPTEHPIEK